MNSRADKRVSGASKMLSGSRLYRERLLSREGRSLVLMRQEDLRMIVMVV